MSTLAGNLNRVAPALSAALPAVAPKQEDLLDAMTHKQLANSFTALFTPITEDLVPTEQGAGEPEVCVCAAIKSVEGEIVKGHRHHNCISTMSERGIPKAESIQGFLTNYGSFVTREEGRKLQDAAGIKSTHPDGYFNEGTLCSEDLY